MMNLQFLEMYDTETMSTVVDYFFLSYILRNPLFFFPFIGIVILHYGKNSFAQEPNACSYCKPWLSL